MCIFKTNEIRDDSSLYLLSIYVVGGKKWGLRLDQTWMVLTDLESLELCF